MNATAALPPDTNVAVPPDASAVAHPSTESARQASPSPASRRARAVSNRAEGSDGIQQSTFHGTWEIRQSPKTGTVHLRLTEGDWSSGFSIPVDRLEGISVRPARERQRARQVQHPARRRDVRLRGHGEGWCRRRRVLLQPQHGIRPGARETGLWPADRRRTVLACAR